MFFIIFLYFFRKDSSANYYQDNKQKLQKKLVEDIEIFLEMKNKTKKVTSRSLTI